MPKKKLFKDSPGGIQLHAGTVKGEQKFHSDDGGKTWWSAYFFKGTKKQLVDMALSILREATGDKANV